MVVRITLAHCTCRLCCLNCSAARRCGQCEPEAYGYPAGQPCATVYYLDLLLLVAQVAQDGFSLQPVYRASDPACIYKQAQPATAGPGPTLFESNEKAVQELQVRSAQSDHSV